MKPVVTCLVALALICARAGQAKADVIFSNFGPGDSFDSAQSTTIQPSLDFAFAFTAKGNFLVDGIELAVAASGGFRQLTVSLATDAGGVPGAVLESFHFSVVPTSAAIIGAASLAHPALTQDTRYWLFGEAPADVEWFHNSIGQMGPHADRSPGNPWRALGQTTEGAFRISGTPQDASVIPEPTSMTLLSLALVGMAGYYWCRRRSDASAGSASASDHAIA